MRKTIKILKVKETSKKKLASKENKKKNEKLPINSCIT